MLHSTTILEGGGGGGAGGMGERGGERHGRGIKIERGMEGVGEGKWKQRVKERERKGSKRQLANGTQMECGSSSVCLNACFSEENTVPFLLNLYTRIFTVDCITTNNLGLKIWSLTSTESINANVPFCQTGC